jgi:transposase
MIKSISETHHNVHLCNSQSQFVSTLVFKGRLPPENRAYARYLRSTDELSLREIARLCKMSPSSVKRCTESDLPGIVNTPRISRMASKRPGGRQRKLTTRTERYVVRELRKLRRSEGTFSVARLMTATGISQANVTIRTVCNVLHRNGYGFYQARKKGLLSDKDLKHRVKFANKMIRRPESFWCRDIAFYLDGVSFVYKTNPLDQGRAPRSRIYRKRSEGLSQDCTSKGRKEGTGGKYAKLVVAISYGKGVIICEPYEKMNGEYFASFIEGYFKQMFRHAGKDSMVFIQDGDPSQNSAAAKRAMQRVKAQLLPIPARSPDLNPIENMFHLVSQKLKNDAIRNNLTHESFQQFQDRVISTINAIPLITIDRTIASMHSRLRRIIDSGGERTKY